MPKLSAGGEVARLNDHLLSSLGRAGYAYDHHGARRRSTFSDYAYHDARVGRALEQRIYGL